MKKIFSIITIVILLLTSANSYVFAIENESTISNKSVSRGVGDTFAETFPDPELAKYLVSQLKATSVNDVLTQTMIDNYTSINIYSDSITDLTGIDVFNKAVSLYVVGLQTDSIGDEICNLTNLKTLQISENQFVELPDCIGNLSNLESFHIQNNTRLSSIPESIGQLSTLQRMTIVTSDSLTSLPNSLGNLSSLTNLDIIFTPIVTLPDSFGNLAKLNTLVIQATELNKLPESFVNLPSLRVAVLLNNKIESLPENIGNLTTLVNFQLTYNCLTQLPQSIGNLNRLTFLTVENNQLTSVPSSIVNLPGAVKLASNLLPTDYATKLNEIAGEQKFENELQGQLTLKSSLAPYEIKSGNDINNFDFISAIKLVDAYGSENNNALNPPAPYVLSSSQKYIFENYIDDSGAVVNIDDYIKNGVVQSDITLFAQIRSTGEGVFPNTSEHALTVDKVQLNLKSTPYDVTFDLNGAPGVAPVGESLVEGNNITAVEEPVRDGFIFKGWNTAADGSGVSWDFANTTMPAQNLTLFAIWEAESTNYNLTFDLNGAPGVAPDTQSVAQGDVASNVTAPSRDGYVFKGWNTMADGTGLNWVLGETTMPAQNVTLFAIWEINGAASVDVTSPSTLPTTGSTLNIFGFVTILSFALVSKLKNKF